MADQTNEHQALYARIIARAWSDQAFKQRLLAEPAAVLLEEGVTVPDGLTVMIHENTASTIHFTLPEPPAEGEISEDSLSDLSGGQYERSTGCCGELCTF